VPALNIFETSFRKGKFDASRKLSDGSMMDFKHIYPMDAVYDTPEDVPEEVGGPAASARVRLALQPRCPLHGGAGAQAHAHHGPSAGMGSCHSQSSSLPASISST
jgi:hypothetical protein